jgi:hypothetical protein
MRRDTHKATIALPAVLNADESQLQEPARLAAGMAAQGLVDASPAG